MQQCHAPRGVGTTCPYLTLDGDFWKDRHQSCPKDPCLHPTLTTYSHTAFSWPVLTSLTSPSLLPVFLLSDPAHVLARAKAAVTSCCVSGLRATLSPPVCWVWSRGLSPLLRPGCEHIQCRPAASQCLRTAWSILPTQLVPLYILYLVYCSTEGPLFLESSLLLTLALPSRMASPSHLLSGTVHPLRSLSKALDSGWSTAFTSLKHVQGPVPPSCRLSFLTG